MLYQVTVVELSPFQLVLIGTILEAQKVLVREAASTETEAGEQVEIQKKFVELLELVGEDRKETQLLWDTALANVQAGLQPFPPGEPVNRKRLRSLYRSDR